MTPNLPQGDISIRAAASRDAAALASLSEGLGYRVSEAVAGARLESILANPDHGLFVAESGGEVVGWVHVYAYCSLLSGRAGELGGLVVHEGHQRQGAGQQLMERAETWAWKKGCNRINVRSRVTREVAHQFYSAMDYPWVKDQKVFRKSAPRMAKASTASARRPQEN